ncbi:MAG: RpiB/LacA/LacB family sugar-phosphate isomerase [Clostridia bacterium]|nr:RpiB/LacA/LacB family sugar-phosphate isomerase [Clostridia bacterium]MBQ8792303.1 RpiB/LacA/LacB family sugar-phosphate isomerase [Clostridia bacterium]
MKIALINENSQCSKNELIFNTLSKVADEFGHEVLNFGTYGPEDATQLTYVEAGLLIAILLNTKTVDFVVTGCGTGEGACLAANSFPNVLCGHIVDPSDGYMFMQINDGNAVSFPFAKGFGWGAELNLEYTFRNMFGTSAGGGYPKERVIPEQRNKKILDEVKKITHQDMLYIVKNIDQEILKHTISGKNFKKLFLENCDDSKLSNYIKTLIK